MEDYVVYRYNKSILNTDEWLYQDLNVEIGKNMSRDAELMKKKILFTVASKGRHRICYVKNSKGELVHYSFIIPYCAKFSFMNKGDFCIGPCWTKEDYRGKGIYGSVLNYIAKMILKDNETVDLYVLIREANASSTRGIQKANFVPVGKSTKTKYLKHYKKVEWF